jgi:hypothetical protein
MDTNGGRWGEPGINLNSRTHQQINQLVSRQDAKAQRGRERRGNFAGKQEECRVNHRGPPRGTEGERKRGRGEGDNIQYSTRNLQYSRGNAEKLALHFLLYYPLTQNGLWQWHNEKRVLKTQLGGIVVKMGGGRGSRR